MDTAKYTLTLAFGDQTIDYSDQLLAESIKRKLCIGKAGKHEIQTCDFQLQNSAGVTSRIFTSTKDIHAVLKREGEPYFTGIIRPYARQRITQVRSEPISLQIMDNSKLLEKSVYGKVDVLSLGTAAEDVVFTQRWQNVSLINRANPNRSLVHLLFHAANLGIDYTLHCPFDRPENFPIFILKKGDTLSEVVETLLYEYGLTYRATESGDFEILDLAPEGFTATEVISEFHDSLSIDKPDSERKTVKVSYGKLDTQGISTIWDSGLTTSEPVYLKYQDTYPENAKDHTVCQSYAVNGYEDWSIYDVQDLKVIGRIGNGPTITDVVSAWNGTTMPFQLYVKQLDSENASIYVKHIDTETKSVALTELKIKGDVWLRNLLETAISVIQGESLSTYASKYVFNKVVAEKLRDMLANRSSLGGVTYSFGSNRVLPIGAIVSLNDSISSFTALARVISRQNTLRSDIHTYECEAVSQIEYNRTADEIEWAENFVQAPTVKVPELLTLDVSASQFNYDSSGNLKGPESIEVQIRSSGLAEAPTISINGDVLDSGSISMGTFSIRPIPSIFNSDGFIVIEAACGELRHKRLIAKSVDGVSAQAVSISGPQMFKYASGALLPTMPSITLHATTCGNLIGYQWFYHNGLGWQRINGATGQDYTLAHDAPFFSSDSIRIACFSEEYYDEITIAKVYDGIQGPKGQDGRATYFHLKYSANASGSPMSETPSTYIGTYVDHNENDSNDYRDYTWTRFEGLQGEKGEQGIPGPQGDKGDIGSTGPAGSPATAYWLNVSVASMKRGRDRQLTPQTISIVGMKKTGTESPSPYACRFAISEATYEKKETYVDRYVSYSDMTAYVYTPTVYDVKTSAVCSIKIKMYDAKNSSIILDEKIIPVVSDGVSRDLQVIAVNGAINVAGYDEDGQEGAGFLYYQGDRYIQSSSYSFPNGGASYGCVLVNLQDNTVVFARYEAVSEGDNSSVQWKDCITGTAISVLDHIVLASFRKKSDSISVRNVSPCIPQAFVEDNVLDIISNEGIDENADVDVWAKALGADRVLKMLISRQAIIEDLLSNTLRIKDGGAIYSGCYDAHGNKSTNDSGLYFSASGNSKVNDIEMNNVIIQGNSTLNGLINHKSLTTVDEAVALQINTNLDKLVPDKWNTCELYDFINQNAPQNTFHMPCTLIYDGNSYSSLWLKRSGSILYHSDVTPHRSAVSAGGSNSDFIDYVVPAFSSPIYVKASCSLPGNMNAAYWTVYRNGKWLDMNSNCNFYVIPGDKIRMYGHSWAWWGTQNITNNGLYLYSQLDEGLLLGYNLLQGSSTTITGTSASGVWDEKKTWDFITDSGTNQVAISFWGSQSQSKLQLFEGSQLISEATPNYQSRMVANVKGGTRYTLKALVYNWESSNDDSTSYYHGQMVVDSLLVVFKHNFDQGLLLTDTAHSIEIPFYTNGLRFQTKDIAFESKTAPYVWKSNEHVTYIDGIQLINQFAKIHDGGWKTVSQNETHTVSINGNIPFYPVEVLATAKSIQFRMSDNNYDYIYANDSAHDCYTALSAILSLVNSDQKEHIKTTDILPKLSNTYNIGNALNKYNVGWFNTIWGAVAN